MKNFTILLIEENDRTFAHIKLSNISSENFSNNFKIYNLWRNWSLYFQSFLIENKTNWMEENFNFIYQTSFENNSSLELQKFYIDLISKDPD
ncbi:hypothetical protein RhiirB3_444466 [Rhizophagus irregularis]|nr:hypothetical protein RhiirB3_444466 [Rhizophagus irregularis]